MLSDGIIYGSPTISTSIFKTGNSSLTLTNSGDFVSQYLQFPSYNFTGSTYTVSWWFKLTSTTWGNTMIFSNLSNNAYTSGYYAQINNTSTTITPFSPVASSLLDNNWHLMVMQINASVSSGTKGLLSIDGAPYGTYTTSNSNWVKNLNCLYNYYGFSNWDASQYSNGNICDIRFYSGALTTQQIAALYNIGSSSAKLTTYSVIYSSGIGTTISWTGTSVSYIILTNKTTGTSYGPISTSGQVYNLTFTSTDIFYITPFDSSNVAGLATQLLRLI
jgi:hypothetical protein